MSDESNISKLSGTAFYNFNRDQLESLANTLMEQIETVAYHDGIISDKYLLSRNYVITLVRPGIFTRIFNKLFMRGVDSGSAVFRILAVPADLDEYDPDNEERTPESKKKTAKIVSIYDGSPVEGTEEDTKND